MNQALHIFSKEDDFTVCENCGLVVTPGQVVPTELQVQTAMQMVQHIQALQANQVVTAANTADTQGGSSWVPNAPIAPAPLSPDALLVSKMLEAIGDKKTAEPAKPFTGFKRTIELE